MSPSRLSLSKIDQLLSMMPCLQRDKDTRSRFQSRSWGQFRVLASHLAILVVMMRHNHILGGQNNIREGLSVLAPEDPAPCQGLGKLEQTGQGLNKGATNHTKYIVFKHGWISS